MSAPGDAHEREADQVAMQVMRMPDRGHCACGGGCPSCRGSRAGGGNVTPISRAIKQGLAGQHNSGGQVSEGFSANLQKHKHSGKHLSTEARAFFEPRFGEDFSNIRIHDDPAAANMALSINARAFTHGPDIYFAPGQYDPNSHYGRSLLAHELTHNLQQDAAGHEFIARQLFGPSTHHMDVADMTYEQRLSEALEEALPAFGTWLFISIAILLLTLALIYAIVTLLLMLVPEAWAAWITATLSVLGVILGIGFVIDAVRRSLSAATQLRESVNNATTHEDLDRAGEVFGREMAIVVIEIVAAVLAFAGARGIRLPSNGPVTTPASGSGGTTAPAPAAGGSRAAAPRVAPPAEPPPVRAPAAEPPVAEAPAARPAAPRPAAEAPAPEAAPAARGGGRAGAGGGRPELSREAMRQFLQQVWDQNPILHRLASARSLRGDALVQTLRNLLRQFQSETGIIVEEVANGTVQAARGSGNLASLRSRPGHLQIEAQVFQNPQTLLTEVTHEFAFHFSRVPLGRSPLLGEGPLGGIELLEMLIQAGGNMARVLPP